MFLVFLYTCYKYGSGVFGTNMFYIIMGFVMLGLAVWLFYKKVYRYGLLKKACTIPVEARIYAVDSKFGGRIADAIDRAANDLLVIELCFGRDFARNNGEPRRHERFARDAAHRILRETRV